MSNRLKNELSPYLLQHAENPVDWYPWGNEAFEKAQKENKPIFLSIGYSTCHWCHVMARESFENAEIAQLLNKYFVSVKVDREERPDVDQVYMTVCQALTGSGGWPTSLFLTPELKPFFAGTYFPPKGNGGFIGFFELLELIAKRWREDKEALVSSAENIISQLKEPKSEKLENSDTVIEKAVFELRRAFDEKNGGFGSAPKFPVPHGLIFLLLYGYWKKDAEATDMALFTLTKMYSGGIYDHIGGGFSRYSTDELFLVPHFEKMLYDNALLITAYTAGYSACKNEQFLEVAMRCCEYVMRELSDENGGFYSAQDADSKGGEGEYYLFDYDEIVSVLGEESGRAFCQYYGVTKLGNFQGKNILNRLHGGKERDFSSELQKLYCYRKQRSSLRLDDKILTVWNSLMITALVCLYRVTGKSLYIETAVKTANFIENKLSENGRLKVGMRNGVHFSNGFFDDYAFYASALICLYSATANGDFLERAKSYAETADKLFCSSDGGYVMNGRQNEKLIISAKETYDGAMPSANSVFFFVLSRLSRLLDGKRWYELKERQKEFLLSQSADFPYGHTMFTAGLIFDMNPPPKITVVCPKNEDVSSIIKKLPLYSDIELFAGEKDGFSLMNGKTTYYVCKSGACLAPTNELKDLV